MASDVDPSADRSLRWWRLFGHQDPAGLDEAHLTITEVSTDVIVEDTERVGPADLDGNDIQVGDRRPEAVDVVDRTACSHADEHLLDGVSRSDPGGLDLIALAIEQLHSDGAGRRRWRHGQ